MAKVYELIEEYFINTEGIVGERCTRKLLLSIASYYLAPILKDKNIYGRSRRHILLNWTSGEVKSSYLQRFSKILPEDIKSGYLTTITPPAMYGTVHNKKLVYPELKSRNVIILEELSTVVNSMDTEMIGVLLAAMELGMISVKRVKFAGAFDELDPEEYPDISFKEDRIEYECDTIFWAATHTLENIPKSYREAFLSRFDKIYISPDEFTNKALLTRIEGGRLRDSDYELELKAELGDYLNNGIEERLFEGDLAPFVVNYTIEMIRKHKSRITMRGANDVQKNALCFAIYEDNKTVLKKYIEEELLEYTKKEVFLNLDTADKIRFILSNNFPKPLRVKEIMNLTGIKQSTILYHFRNKNIAVKKIVEKMGKRMIVKFVLDEAY